MGLIKKILEFARASRNDNKVSELKADPGWGGNETSDVFQPAGDDSQPLPGDFAVIINLEDSRSATVGYIDPVNDDVSEPGEVRRYSRDSSGAVKAELWIKNDGSVVVSNDNNSVTLEANGDIKLGESSLKALIHEDIISAMNAHTHSGVTAGGGVTGPPTYAPPLSTALHATQKVTAQ